MRPFWRDGAVFCHLASVGHWHAVGGSVPVNYNPVATESFQEGMLIPPIKIGENYRLKEDLLTMMAAMTRDQRTLILDIKARLAAVRSAQRRIREVIANSGVDFLIGALRKTLSGTG